MRAVCLVVILAAVLNAQEVVNPSRCGCAGGTAIDVPAVKSIDESKVPLVANLKRAPRDGVSIIKTGWKGWRASGYTSNPFPDVFYLWVWDGKNWLPLENAWTCEDQDRAVMTSVNGSKHWCHKETP